MVTISEMKEIVDRCWSITKTGVGHDVENPPDGFDLTVFNLHDMKMSLTVDHYGRSRSLSLSVFGCGSVFMEQRSARRSFIEWGDLSQGVYILRLLREHMVLEDLASL